LAAIKAIIDPLMVPTATDEMKSIYVLVRLRSDLPENAVVEDFDWAKYLGKNETGGRHDSHFQSNSVINNEVV
jgi:propanediol dehydratase large subunit